MQAVPELYKDVRFNPVPDPLVSWIAQGPCLKLTIWDGGEQSMLVTKVAKLPLSDFSKLYSVSMCTFTLCAWHAASMLPKLLVYTLTHLILGLMRESSLKMHYSRTWQELLLCAFHQSSSAVLHLRLQSTQNIQAGSCCPSYTAVMTWLV